MISTQFFKNLLSFASLATTCITFSTTSDITIFSTTSILALINNIISCLDKDYEGKDCIFKFTSLFIKVEICVAMLIFLFSSNISKYSLDQQLRENIVLVSKWILVLILITGMILLWILSGLVDTEEDKKIQKAAKQYIREINSSHYDKKERKGYYNKLKNS